jgi:hypothetical protein
VLSVPPAFSVTLLISVGGDIVLAVLSNDHDVLLDLAVCKLLGAGELEVFGVMHHGILVAHHGHESVACREDLPENGRGIGIGFHVPVFAERCKLLFDHSLRCVAFCFPGQGGR